MKMIQQIKNRQNRFTDWLSALLLLAAFWAASNRLNLTEWSPDLYKVHLIALLGVLLGLAAGFSIFRRGTVMFLAGAYGFFLIVFQMSTGFSSYVLWSERLYHLLGRITVTLSHLFSGQPVKDVILFNLFIYTLMWSLAFFAGFYLVRKQNAWAALAPTGILMVAVQNFDGTEPLRMWYLAIFLLIWIILAGRVYQHQSRTRWIAKRTKLPLYLNWDLMRFSSFFIAILVITSWIVPAAASSIEPAEKLWDAVTAPFDFLEEQFNNAFFPLRQPGFLQNDYFGSNLPLGSGNYLSDQVVLDVTSPRRSSSNIRYYWRVRVYDTYLDGSWSSSANEYETVAANSLKVFFPDLIGRTEVAVDITPGVPAATLYTLPQPRQIDTLTQITFFSNPDGSADISLIKADKLIKPGESYQVEASVSSATIYDLYNSGTDYPAWVIERYLSVPDGISERTRELAAKLSQDLDNPYMVTQSVSDYLRENIAYSETVERYPSDQDPIDWFLFDYQQGFCNYYASSMVILLRLQGIPARMAVGYAEGERLTEDEIILPEDESGQNLDLIEQNEFSSEKYIVRQKDAHAWPEVYFAGIGWVEFEPTANQVPLIRTQGLPLPDESDEENNQDPAAGNTEDNEIPPEEELEPDTPEETAADDPIEAQAFSIPPAAVGVLTAVAVGAAAALSWRAARSRGVQPLPVLVTRSMVRFNLKPPRLLSRWAKETALSPIAKAYQQINKALIRLGASPQPDQTPAERAENLKLLLPEISAEVDLLLNEYEKSTYSPHEAELETAKEAGRATAKASRLQWFMKWFTRFQEKPDDERGTVLELD